MHFNYIKVVGLLQFQTTETPRYCESVQPKGPPSAYKFLARSGDLAMRLVHIFQSAVEIFLKHQIQDGGR